MNHYTYLNPKVLDLPSRRYNGAAIHVNPNFRVNRNVYVNPLFVNTGPISQPSTSGVCAPVAQKPPTPYAVNKFSKYTWRKKPDDGKSPKLKATTKIVTKCGKKLVRKPISPVQRYQTTAKRTNKDVCSKFKLDKRPLDVRRRSAGKKSLYKIQNLFPKNVYTVNKLVNRSRPKDNNNKKRSANKKLVNIGGILYRVTSNKLTRAAAPASTSFPTKPKKGIKATNKLVINVMGESFILSRNGATLKRLQTDNTVTHPRQRVDFGGVTYKQTTDGIFVRTNAHKVRTVLTQARHRSLAFLAARRRKINTPCQVYRKLGRCARNQSGICVYTHDKKNIDLCKRFLQGKCTNKNCLLSHEVVHQKVPTCKFFLDGSCGRDNCPYLHVKVSERADVCLPFLQGYCNSGDQCSKRHVNICPEFEKTGLCKKGKQCPYPHKRVKKLKPRTKRKSKPVEKKKRVEEDSSNKGDAVRYYAAESETVDKEVVLPKRQRLESLPSFIAFDDNS